MDLSAFNEASNAVKKLMKDYQPIERLAVALEQVSGMLSNLDDLDKAKVKAQAELQSVVNAKAAAEAELARVKREAEKAQSVLDSLKATLSGIKL